MISSELLFVVQLTTQLELSILPDVQVSLKTLHVARTSSCVQMLPTLGILVTIKNCSTQILEIVTLIVASSP